MKLRFNIKGETLAETIIALSILAIGISVSSTVVLNSIRNLSNAKNRVIAVNIAREGIEAVRSVRDTNWLFYSDRRRECWNHDPSKGICDGSLSIEPNTYIVYKHSPEGSWRLQPADENEAIDSSVPLDGDPANDLDLVSLSLVDIDTNIDSDGLDPDNSGDGLNDDTDMYNHRLPSVVDPFGAFVKNAIFSRYITIEYLPNRPFPPPNDSIKAPAIWATTADKETYNRMRITSVVSWQLGGNLFVTQLQTILTDHLGREDLET